MNAIILAAGCGSRLYPITENIPKCMVEVNGLPLINNALNILDDLHIKTAAIVVGHKANLVKQHIGNQYKNIHITYYENKEYQNSNNIYSLYIAKDFLQQDTLLLECDLFYRAELIKPLLYTKEDCNILVSPFNPKTMDGTVIVADSQKKALELILGKWQNPTMKLSEMYKTVNIYRFSKTFLVNEFIPLLEWFVINIGRNSYYEIVLGMLIYLKQYDIKISIVDEQSWCEIDDASDLAKAHIMF